MNTYIVHVYIPTAYEIEAETQEEAVKQALAAFEKEEEKPLIGPIIDAWIKSTVYKGKSMHEIELEKLEKEKKRS